MTMRVPDEWLRRAAKIPDLRAATGEDLRRVVAADADVAAWAPDARVAVDPRSGVRTVYSPARARRPHDRPPPPPPPLAECLVCAGKTTDVVDVAPLSGGHSTFVNLNLFPVVWPFDDGGAGELGPTASGIHLLQWVSTDHDADLDDLDPADGAVLLERLGILEDRLHSIESFPETRPGRRGHVGIMKNVGRLVGGSIVHGHQQVFATNVRPLALEGDAAFLEREGTPFASWILRETPDELRVAERDGVAILVPPFMARPLDMMIVVEDPAVADVGDLDDRGRLALATALREATRAVVALMPRQGREVAYNLAFHNGIAGGLYVEVLPYTQEQGGCEKLGLNLCQGSPEDAAAELRAFLDPGGEAR